MSLFASLFKLLYSLYLLYDFHQNLTNYALIMYHELSLLKAFLYKINLSLMEIFSIIVSTYFLIIIKNF